jgi:hypothetical protein
MPTLNPGSFSFVCNSTNVISGPRLDLGENEGRFGFNPR